VTYALPAGQTPNFIFPFAPGTVFTIINLDNLIYFLYRPLYWFGEGQSPLLNQKRSLAYPPTYKGKVVTIRLKPGLRWSNGTTITAKNVVFWMNMMKAEAPLNNWGGYVQHRLPDNVKNIHAVSTYEMQMTIIGKYTPLWFTDNELSQITPMPEAWDRTGPHTTSDCTDHVSDCVAVFNYLDSQAGINQSKTWTTSPLWTVVDGPWHLTGLTAQGVLTFTYNRSYSLPVPPQHITKFVEVPFTTEQAEFNQLQAGGTNAIDVGYLPTVDAPEPPAGVAIGQNPVSGYTLQPVYTWGLSYIPYNFGYKDPQLAIISQTYFRHAFQLLVNQAEIIQGALHGYGKISTGPVGDTPPTEYLSPQALKGDPYPYNTSQASLILRDHGWQIKNGVTTKCIDPGSGLHQCGKGVERNATLKFDMLFATGNAWVQAAVLQLQTNASYVGIQVNLKGEPFDQVIGTVSNGCGPNPQTPGPCKWELADWGLGWSYVPDYLPTGDELFATGSIGNIGAYSNSQDDQLINKTLVAPSKDKFLSTLYTWQDWLTGQFPVMLQPTPPAYLIESKDSLKIGPQSPTLALTPEEWHYVR
jgi:peptide/nickel transport system substrate-binding protein